jgi:thioester reductase-like protein
MPGAHGMDRLSLEAEAALDPAIQFPAALSKHALTPQTVFLTGATGFLGAYLLDELLCKTDADIFCLIRADDREVARARLVQHLQKYGLWQEAFAARIHPVVGDLTQPRLGLTEAAFCNLAGHIDVIYHSAGSINALYPYAQLKATNVLGTQEILRLAGLVQTKPVHYLSSMAVFFTDAYVGVDRLRESELPRYHPSLKGGYTQSKWVADRLVLSAQERGLAACIYRCVRVMGHSQTGAMNEMHDILPLVLKGCVQLGKCPVLDVEVTLAPVDYVSQAVVHLSRQARSYGRAFHLLTPRPIPWPQLMATIRSFGYALEEFPYDQWRREVRQQASQGADKHFYTTLLMVLLAPHYLFYRRPLLDTQYTREGLADTAITCPPAEPSLMGKYIAYWQKIGYFPLPSTECQHEVHRTML